MMARSQPNTMIGTQEGACFRIGTVDLCLSTDQTEVMEEFTDLYRSCQVDTPPKESAIRLAVRANSRRWRKGREWLIEGDGQPLWTASRRCEILPYLEWGINWRVIARRSELLLLHAATLSWQGQGMILAAESGSGKSTLTAGLLAGGWKYLCDEFALIAPFERLLLPFPKALCVKEGAFDLLADLNLPLWRGRHFVKALKGPVGYLRPTDIRPDAVSGPAPVRWLVFPQYIPGVRPSLRPMPPAQAAFLLARSSFNRGRWGGQALPLLTNLVRKADCYHLQIGPLQETCSLLRSCLADRVADPADGGRAGQSDP